MKKVPRDFGKSIGRFDLLFERCFLRGITRRFVAFYRVVAVSLFRCTVQSFKRREKSVFKICVVWPFYPSKGNGGGEGVF